MTAMPEAKLAREAELPYAIVGMVTDYDCWHDDHEHVTVDAVVKVMVQNAANARKLIQAVAPKLGPDQHRHAPWAWKPCSTAAVMTSRLTSVIPH